MRIKDHIDSLQDLGRWVSPRFIRRLKRLVSIYNSKRIHFAEPLIIRAVCIAMSFADVAGQGNQALAASFDAMMHGRTEEQLMYQGQQVLLGEDHSDEEHLVWDTTCILLEEFVPGNNMPQYAYDIVDGRVTEAYGVLKGEDTTEAETLRRQLAEAMRQLETTRRSLDRAEATIACQQSELTFLRSCISNMVSGQAAALARSTTTANFNGSFDNKGTVTGDLYNKNL